jgi:hypothetical protein
MQLLPLLNLLLAVGGALIFLAAIKYLPDMMEVSVVQAGLANALLVWFFISCELCSLYIILAHVATWDLSSSVYWVFHLIYFKTNISLGPIFGVYAGAVFLPLLLWFSLILTRPAATASNSFFSVIDTLTRSWFIQWHKRVRPPDLSTSSNHTTSTTIPQGL